MKKTSLKRIAAVLLTYVMTASSTVMNVSAEPAADSWLNYKLSWDSGIEFKLDDLMPPSEPGDYLNESLKTTQQIVNATLKDKYQNSFAEIANWATKSSEIDKINKQINYLNQQKEALNIRKGLDMFRMKNPSVFDKEQYNYLMKLKDKGLDKQINALNNHKADIAKGSAKTGFAKTTGKVLGVLFTLKSCKDYYDNPKVGFKSPTLELIGSSIKASSAVSGFFNEVPVVGQIASAIYGVADLAVNNQVVVEFCNRNADNLGYIDETVSKTNDNIQYLFEWLFFSDVDEQIRQNEEELRQRREKYGLQTPQGSGVGVYKPNIYLYPAEETEVQVSFRLPDLLTKTIPEYGTGWKVKACPDGSLTAEGQEYGFLFYESETYPHYWQQEEGFVIPAENREAVFRRILTGYGLNETEIRDFCEFWCEKLDADTSYAMYPQLTEAVDAAMPADITPAPDTVVRLWFAFSPDQTPESTAVPEAVPRKGFTVIEWGGLFL